MGDGKRSSRFVLEEEPAEETEETVDSLEAAEEEPGASEGMPRVPTEEESSERSKSSSSDEL